MNLHKFVRKINNIETSVDLSALNCFGFNPWPLIRLSILHNVSSKNQRKMGKLNQLKKIMYYFKQLLNAYILYKKNPLKHENIDIVFFSRLSESQDIIENNYFNRYSDSFRYFFTNQYKIKTVEINDQEWLSKRKYFNLNITYIDFLVKKAKLKCKLSQFFSQIKKNYLYDINQKIFKEFGFKVNVHNDLYWLNYLSKEYEKILKSYSPKLVFIVCFYRIDAMAMSLACNKLGIKSVEYQHGAQNDYHAMYTNWENIPQKGYELIPDVFWMWGKISKNRIDKWAAKTDKHQAVVGGNIWMTYFLQKNISIDKIKKYYNIYNTNILVSLQGDSFFPNYLLDIISNFSHNTSWHFREHPRLPISSALRNKIESLDNTEIEFSSIAPLYDLLKLTDIHLTGFSTVAFEAQNFCVPTIFTHENALNGFHLMINKNGLFFSKNYKETKVLIKKLMDDTVRIEPEYIISNLTLHKNTLSILMDEK
ncbi:MAG: hypothetical protein KZQ70_05700 [gamma proteobacterium symbiont of Lucinoma myriamae]|nr:hypothetical protein [gamma proteobacterium symbiont of Lucinoma myriamae]MCU7819645.1 hypothetical protein [gamma proteobacterium symbiont of Lucinoma myriamae]